MLTEKFSMLFGPTELEFAPILKHKHTACITEVLTIEPENTSGLGLTSKLYSY